MCVPLGRGIEAGQLVLLPIIEAMLAHNADSFPSLTPKYHGALSLSSTDTDPHCIYI